jgi:predicted component of type VI protein secretion system
VAQVLHTLFGFSFHFTENITAEYATPDELQCRLGGRNNRVSRDFIIGRSFRECDSSYELTIGKVKSDDVAALLPGKPKRRKIEWVLSICMPTNLEHRIRIKVDAAETRLGPSPNRSYLGLSSVLQSRRGVARRGA